MPGCIWPDIDALMLLLSSFLISENTVRSHVHARPPPGAFCLFGLTAFAPHHEKIALLDVHFILKNELQSLLLVDRLGLALESCPVLLN